MVPYLFLAQAGPTTTTEPEEGIAYRNVEQWTGSEGWANVARWAVDTPLRILVIWAVAWLVARILRRIIGRAADRLIGSASSGRLRRVRDRAPAVLVSGPTPSVRASARAETIGGVLRSVTSGIVYIFAVVYSLEALGLNLGPLIAGAGVLGVALGFGAQSLVRDFLAGTFILIEDQYGVGDVIDLGDAVGTVEAVNLRTTRLRGVDGTVWHVPNGEIQRVGNQSQQWARALLDIVIAHHNDVERALAILKEGADDVSGRPELATDVLEEAEVWGVEDLSPVGVTLRLVVKTLPGSQWRVMRALRQELRARLDDAGIEMPVAPSVAQPPE